MGRVSMDTLERKEMETQNAYVHKKKPKANVTAVFTYFIFAMIIVVCSGAPNCMALNRHPCSAVPNTCGPCFTRHLGEEGYSNGSCFGKMLLHVAALMHGFL